MARVRPISSALMAALLWVAPLAAQDTGTIRGRVTDMGTQEPISGVTVTAANAGAITDSEGRYTITGLPAGTHVVRAQFLGYAEATRSISVAAGQTVVVDFALQTQAIALRGIVAIGYGERRAAEIAGSVDVVTPEEFNTGRIVSPEQLISGKVAGVQIIDTGEPGGKINIRIRGGTSVNASNEPLFVVDGVPIASGDGTSAGRNPLNFLNPDDIQSLTVLKDASAAAIYGASGANGVILIETKSGRRSPAQLSYTGSISGSQTLKRPELLNAAEFRRAVEEFGEQNLDKLGNANTNWQDVVQRDASGQEHNLAFAGAADVLDYRFSLGYLKQNGIIRGTDTERLSAALNYGHRLFNDRLNLRAHIKGARTEDHFAPGGVIGASNALAPTQPVRNPDGTFFEWEEALGPNNPVPELELSTDEGRLYRVIGNLEARYNVPFLTGLVAHARGSYDLTKGERRQFFPSTLRWQQEQSIGGRFRRENPTATVGVVDGFFNYQRPLGFEQSNLDLTAGYSYSESQADYPTLQADSLATDLLGPNGVPSAAEVLPFLDVQESKKASFFGRMNYTIRDRYILFGSVRRDGSSRFGEENRWGTFPSAGFAWRLSEESFLKGRYASLSELKLRFSWGVTGNDAFSNYAYFSSFLPGDAQAMVQFGDQFITTIRPSAVDPNIKWEETTSYNAGLDFGLWGNRLVGTLDVYDKKTEDLIFRVPVAAGTNVSDFVTTNIGSMKNRGFEVGLNAEIFRAPQRGAFAWDVSFNAAHNTNELTRINLLNTGVQQVLVGGISGGVGNTIQVLRPGEPVNSFFVLKHKRENGKPIYADTDGDGDIDDFDLYEDIDGDSAITVNDRTPLENPAPDWIFGHTSNMSFKNFDASFTLRASLGQHVYNNVASNQGHYQALRVNAAPINLHRSVLENNFDSPQYFSDVYLEDASYLRMDNITLGYTFTGLRWTQRLRVFGTVQNAFTMTDYSGVDPAAGLNGIDNNIYPRSRTFTAGINVGF